MKILAMFLKKTLKNFFQGIKKPGCGLCSVGCALGSFFFGVLRVLPPWRSAFGAGKNLPVSCPFPVKNDTVAISRFYQFSITIALRISAKKDIFPHGEIEKLLSWGSPAAAGMGDWGKERAAGTVPAARMFFVDNFRKGYHLRYAPLYPQHCNAECYIACLWCWSARFYSSVIYPVGNGLHCGMCRGHTASRPFLSLFPKDGHILSFFRLPFFRLVLV